MDPAHHRPFQEHRVIDLVLFGRVTSMQYTDALINRLKRVEGQIRGVQSMMTDEKDCKDVVTQLSAIRSAVDKAIAAIVVENLEDCIRKEVAGEGRSHDVVEQAMELLLKSR